jgi:Domain of unknown function (DUF5658)
VTSNISVLQRDWSLSLEVFLFLQMMDVLTTWLGLKLHCAEASPFIRYLMQMGPLAGLIGAKVIAVLLGGYCVYRQRFRVIQIINYFFAALVTWNMAMLLLVRQ